MRTKDFYFDLPEELIAQHPSGIRGQDKLMVLDKATGDVRHQLMDDLPDLVPQNALMVFNNSRVRRSRVYGIKENTGRETEFLFLTPLAPTLWKTMVKNAKKQRPGNRYRFPDGSVGVITENPADAGTEFRTLSFTQPIEEQWFERNGHIPLPPYIKRKDTEEDSERYQNIYARETGSAACPTAGLHFTERMLEKLDSRGIRRTFVTLHVGLGTFLPVRAERIEDHTMHEETYSVSRETAELVNTAKKEGRPVLAVGTTSVRTLESAWDPVKSELIPGINSTRIFMYPGYRFNVVDKMFTNFHTPESTLLMLVSAFAGKEHIMDAYRNAVAHRYRFFSYGDAMLIL
ncbi:tRNA preQ1(34) S-adenosylmethionine ribosyltransferase-isomerase QueA [Treponema brennaborense]|uniref:S-adenosylmethionine:tRNA ribosyltransferase-isomerase n=1 Tax=Treponema brennaborense (strain DSM 12168 / CIP 105900 / DD5/3) TaxID=906968 RepID=F4LNS0_TREBD|nr:tRNA preQ1(34) S-adenosylmethionine ribosyltransferase-isomerase QueA [Treponema brennaborense]AEE16905.1 S-adenosylmethionine:tRNAribosyltransferase-isomerase [Treponema brennaborense DSM 12168]